MHLLKNQKQQTVSVVAQNISYKRYFKTPLTVWSVSPKRSINTWPLKRQHVLLAPRPAPHMSLSPKVHKGWRISSPKVLETVISYESEFPNVTPIKGDMIKPRTFFCSTTDVVVKVEPFEMSGDRCVC
jgi:hypothetical protein